MADAKLTLAFLSWHNHTLGFCQCNYVSQLWYVSVGFFSSFHFLSFVGKSL